MPKDAESLEESRAIRRAVKAEFGCIPESIMRHDKKDQSIDLIADERSYGSKGVLERHGEGRRFMKRAFAMSGMSVRHGALSRFPQNVGRVLLKLYTKPGDWVVDPFAGHNSRMEMCWRAGRNYVGCDISQKFHDANLDVLALLEDERGNQLLVDETAGSTVRLHCCDSRHMPIRDGYGDFTITSPPYWDLENYGDEPEQLGKKNNYAAFLDGIKIVAMENLRVLKPGAYCVWFVNDFKRQKEYYLYHKDVLNIMEGVGFKPWDICIVDLGTAFGTAFASQIVDRKMLPKRHEYALVFQKPEEVDDGA